MSIKFSSYIRQGKKTFRFIRLEGGAYGCSIEYEYGYFLENRFEGVHYSYDRSTEIEEDEDERDGIGGMTSVEKRSAWFGGFTDGLKDGFCVELYSDDGEGFYEMGVPLSFEEFKERAEKFEQGKITAYYYKDLALVYRSGRFAYIGQQADDGKPYFCKGYDNNGEVAGYGFYIGNEHIPFVFEDWEHMPVDAVDEDGFSVLREMDFFSDGNLRYRITEGSFKGGRLEGFGTAYYESNTNGFHRYRQKSGIFSGGELLFGYSDSFENAGGRGKPTTFGYTDGRDISAYGDEITYAGKRYVGEAKDGVPNGIGCLFEDDKMYKGSFKDGVPHGICATYKLVGEAWVPFDYLRNVPDSSFSYNSWGIFAEGEFMPDMSWEEFFDGYEGLKKV